MPRPALLIGDSVAFTLGVGFEQVEPPTLELKNAGLLGCGVIRGDADIGGTWHPNLDKCEHWSDMWPEIIRREQAQVVVGFWGAWDMFGRALVDQHREVSVRRRFSPASRDAYCARGECGV